MSRTRRSSLECLSCKPAVGIAIRVLAIFALALVASCFLTIPGSAVHASGGSLPLGNMIINFGPGTCQGGQWLPEMKCYSGEITGCPNVDGISFNYGVAQPSGAVGVIVYFEGGDGTTAIAEEAEYNMLEYYYGRGYAVVAIQWGSAWQQTSSPNMQNAACRPATFLQSVHDVLQMVTVP